MQKRKSIQDPRLLVLKYQHKFSDQALIVTKIPKKWWVYIHNFFVTIPVVPVAKHTFKAGSWWFPSTKRLNVARGRRASSLYLATVIDIGLVWVKQKSGTFQPFKPVSRISRIYIYIYIYKWIKETCRICLVRLLNKQNDIDQNRLLLRCLGSCQDRGLVHLQKSMIHIDLLRMLCQLVERLSYSIHEIGRDWYIYQRLGWFAWRR